MQPIVNGLQETFGDRAAFASLDAADGAGGQAAYEHLALPGHPSVVIFDAAGRETYRGFGIIPADTLRAAVTVALGQRRDEDGGSSHDGDG